MFLKGFFWQHIQLISDIFVDNGSESDGDGHDISDEADDDDCHDIVVIQTKKLTVLLLPAGDLLKGLRNLCLQLSHKRVTLKTISENEDDLDFESES